jgi:glycosyltransferase involved in cell wall biosynthesis
MHWIGHFPIDGEGPISGRPARWTEEFIEPMDTPVSMSEWGRTILKPVVQKEMQFISHAVNTDVFRPMPKGEARLEVERRLAQLPDADRPKSPQQFMDELEIRKFKLGDRFTVLCVMANRERKYWWDVLRGFRLLLDVVPDARLIGVCGQRVSSDPMAWPLEECCKDLGLRLDFDADDPNVWLIETVVAGHLPEDESMRILYNAADVSVLLSGGEGFGLPQLEAHSCATPCIAGDYSASSELSVHHRELIGPRGFTYTTNNMVRRPIYSPKDLADRLAWVSKNPAWCREVGAAGVAQAQERTWDKILPQWTNLFDTCFDTLAVTHGNADRAAEAASA